MRQLGETPEHVHVIGAPGLDDIPLVDAVYSSCALPGIFEPYERDGYSYMDGGIVDPVPLRFAKTLRPDLIIAVDLSVKATFKTTNYKNRVASTLFRAFEIAEESIVEQILHMHVDYRTAVVVPLAGETERAVEHGATHYCHWFQPMTGLTAEKHDSFLSPVVEGGAIHAGLAAGDEAGDHGLLFCTDPMPMTHERFMRRALFEAYRAREAGEVPVGAVVVAEGVVVGTGFNRPIGARDPTAHAEIVALGAAGQALDNYRLTGTTLYVTVEPCLMCTNSSFGALIGAPGKY